jgi:hypothetical protein
LVAVGALSKLFRGKFLAGLKKLWCEGELKLEGKLAALKDERAFEAWLTPLYQKNWMVYAKAPVSAEEGAEPLLKYLARYVAGVAITDRRIVSLSGGQVTFRWKDYRTGAEGEPATLPVLQFMRQLLLHVLPSSFMRVRYYGLYANRVGSELLRCREKLSLGEPAASGPDDGGGGAAAGLAPVLPCGHSVAGRAERCAACGSERLVLLDCTPRRTWWDLLRYDLRRRSQSAGSAGSGQWRDTS